MDCAKMFSSRTCGRTETVQYLRTVVSTVESFASTCACPSTSGIQPVKIGSDASFSVRLVF